MSTCRKCGVDYTAKPHHHRTGMYICVPCDRAYNKAYRLRRKQQGNPVQTGNMSREYQREYSRQYRERPGVRKRQAAYARRRQRNPKEQAKMACRRLLRSAIEMGLVTREPCSVCGGTPADGHHEDYLQPLVVEWLCRVHHRAKRANNTHVTGQG